MIYYAKILFRMPETELSNQAWISETNKERKNKGYTYRQLKK